MSEASQQSHIGVDLAVDPSSGIQYIRLSLAGTQYMLDVEIAASLGQSLTAVSFRAAFEQIMEQWMRTTYARPEDAREAMDAFRSWSRNKSTTQGTNSEAGSITDEYTPINGTKNVTEIGDYRK